ncbi:MAG TPA: amidohydrolase [Balneolaceae bacterium]
MNWKHRILISATAILTFLALTSSATAQEKPDYWQEDWEKEPTSQRGPNEGGGPYNRLIIRGATVIDGSGAPPVGPMDIIIEGDEIVSIQRTDPDEEPEDAARVIDASGMYVTPGFVNVHVHTGGEKIGYQPSYVYKLWLAHGITTARGVGFGDFEWSLKQRELSAANEIVAPRMVVCARPGSGDEWQNREIRTPKDAREWVSYAKEKGADCLKLGAMDPNIMDAVVDQANSVGLATVAHLDQMGVGRMTAHRASQMGLDEMTHYYGLLESLLDEHTIQEWPVDYNYSNEYHRFSRVARLWNQIHEPGSEEWQQLIDDFLKDDFIISPTMTIYLAGRNVMSARNADWHKEYTLPSQWAFYQPSPTSHGSYFWNWTSADEAAWQNFYNVWMQFLDDYNDAGGRLTVGADAGFIYQLYGFGYIQEMKLLQEAGLTPFEVLRSATLYGAQSIFEPQEPEGEPIKYGLIRAGMKADLLVMTHNPLKDFNLLYATGAMRRNEETGEIERVRALKYTIKDGIVYDAQKLREDIKQMVDQAEQQLVQSD